MVKNPVSLKKINPPQIWVQFFLYYLSAVFIFMLLPTFFLQIVSLNGVWAFLIGLSRYILTPLAMLIVARLHYDILKRRYPKQDIAKYAVASGGLFLVGLFLIMFFPWQMLSGSIPSDTDYSYNFEAISKADKIEVRPGPFVSGDSLTRKTVITDSANIQHIIQQVVADSSGWSRSISSDTAIRKSGILLDFYMGNRLVGEIGLSASGLAAESFFSKDISGDQMKLLLKLIESPS